MPRNQVKKKEAFVDAQETLANEDSTPEKPIEKSGGEKKKHSTLAIYRNLYSLRSVLRTIDPKIAKTTDRLLASIGYPAKLLAYLFRINKLAQLSSAISDYRTFSRLVSTPATLEYALDLLLDRKNPDKVDRWAGYIQGIAGLGFQVLEDLAYLASKNVISISAKRQADFWVWSCYFWAADVVTELLKTAYHYFIAKKTISYRKLAVHLAWLPLTYHWSTYDGVFNEGIVGLLGTAACWPNMVYQWKTA